jgi:uncharacterized protein
VASLRSGPGPATAVDQHSDVNAALVGTVPPEFPEESATDADRAAVTALLTRLPKTAFTVVVRNHQGAPVVIRNAPLEADGTPMPTRFWLIGPAQVEAIGRLEAGGGVRRAQVELDPELIEQTHARHAARRDAALPSGWNGHRPYGGVAGTRRGVKCLHAHYACWLAGEPDVVGEWVAAQLDGELPEVFRCEQG